MIAWQNRPQALVCRYIKECIKSGLQAPAVAATAATNGGSGKQELETVAEENGIRQRNVSESSSSAGAMEQYEDEVGGPAEAAGAKDTHKNARPRFDSLSTIASVRFDN